MTMHNSACAVCASRPACVCAVCAGTSSNTDDAAWYAKRMSELHEERNTLAIRCAKLEARIDALVSIAGNTPHEPQESDPQG